MLKMSNQPLVNRYVAENSQLTTACLKRLLSSNEYEVRENLAKNKKIPTYVLELLSQDKFESVRFFVASHKKTNKAIMNSFPGYFEILIVLILYTFTDSLLEPLLNYILNLII